MNSIIIGTSAAVDGIKASVPGRVAFGVGMFAHSMMDSAAEGVAKAYLKKNGYQYITQHDYYGGVLSEAQIAVTYLAHIDARVSGVRKDIGNVVHDAVQAIHQQPARNGLPPNYENHVVLRLTCPVPVDYRQYTGLSRCYDTMRVGFSSLRRTVAHPGRGCSCSSCIAEYGPAHPLDMIATYDPEISLSEALCRCLLPVLPSSTTQRRAAAKVLMVAELVVLDVVLPYEVYSAIDSITTSLVNAGEKEFAKHLTMRSASAANAFIQKEGFDPMPAADAEALHKVTILVMSAMACNKATTNVQFLEILRMVGKAGIKGVSTRELEMTIDEADQATTHAFGEHDLGLALRPATEITGQLPESGVVFVPNTDALERFALEVKDTGIGGVRTGANILGKNAPIDTRDPLTMFSAVSRHFCDIDKTVQTSDDGIVTYNFTMSKSKSPKPYLLFKRVLTDVFDTLTKLTLEGMKDGVLAFDVDENGRPGSMTAEQYCEAIFEDQLTGSSAGSTDLTRFRGSLFCKSGEDGDRARFISIPGSNGTEALHQARLSNLIKLLEEVCKHFLNHKGVKGLDEDAKREFFGEFLGTLNKDEVGLSFDKSANDRTWGVTVWTYFVEQFSRWGEKTLLSYFTNTYTYTSDEVYNNVKLKMGHQFGDFYFASTSIFLLSGIGPTSLFNRLCAMCEAGVLCHELYGEHAYQEWLQDLTSGPTSARPFWRLHWKYGQKRLPRSGLKLKDINEGDDKVLALNRRLHPNYVKSDGTRLGEELLTVNQLVAEITRIIERECGMCYEVAFTPMPESNCGRKTVFEFCSTIIAINKDQEQPVATMVPKPIKAINKLAWSATRAVDFLLDANQLPQGVIKNEKYHAYCVTKHASLAIINKDSPFIGKMFAANAEYHYLAVKKLVGAAKARDMSTIYTERAPERRKLEEWRQTTHDTLGLMMEAVEDSVISRHFDTKDAYAAAVGWMMEFPRLMETPMITIIATLLECDQAASLLDYDDDTIFDPVYVFQSLPLGCLAESLIHKATAGYRKIITTAAATTPKPETVQRVLESMRGITKTTMCGVTKDKPQDKPKPISSPQANAADHGKGKGKAIAAKGKGKSQPPANAKGKGKGGKSGVNWGTERATATHPGKSSHHKAARWGPA